MVCYKLFVEVAVGGTFRGTENMVNQLFGNGLHWVFSEGTYGEAGGSVGSEVRIKGRKVSAGNIKGYAARVSVMYVPRVGFIGACRFLHIEVGVGEKQFGQIDNGLGNPCGGEVGDDVEDTANVGAD